MKKIIAGRRYDTDSAKKLANWDNGLPINDFSYTEETLYQKRTGEYFLYGESGAAGRYCRSTADGWTGGGAAIVPLTDEEAREWCERHLTAEEIEALWGEPEEDDTAQIVRRLRSECGMTQAAFAEWCGIPYRTYQDWEGGRSIPPAWAVKLLAHYVRTKNGLYN